MTTLEYELYNKNKHYGLSDFASMSNKEYESKYQGHDKDFWRKYVVQDEGSYYKFVEIKHYRNELLKRLGLDIDSIKSYPLIDLTKTDDELKQEAEQFVKNVSEALTFTSEMVLNTSPYSLLPWDSIKQGKSIERLKDEIRCSIITFALIWENKITQKDKDEAVGLANPSILSELAIIQSRFSDRFKKSVDALNEKLEEYGRCKKEFETLLNEDGKTLENCRKLITGKKAAIVACAVVLQTTIDTIKYDDGDLAAALDQYYQARKNLEDIKEAYKKAEEESKTALERLEKAHDTLEKVEKELDIAEVVCGNLYQNKEIIFSDEIMEEIEARTMNLKDMTKSKSKENESK